MNREARPFRFESAWITHSDFPRLMKENWRHHVKLNENLTTMKDHLSQWNANVFGCEEEKTPPVGKA